MSDSRAAARQRHPSQEDLLDRRDDPEIAEHLARCARCRIQTRVLRRILDTDPDTLPGIAEARARMDRAQHEGSISLTTSFASHAGEDAGDLDPGTVVDGRYTVESVVGRGGMGTVYRVRHNELGSHHALKVLHWVSPGIRERLIREGRAQGRLRHPNVIPVTDVVSVDGVPGLILELVDGPSLSEWLREQGLERPPLEVVDALGVGIIRGVAAAHGAGLVHRDLKPGNVLLAPGDEGPVPKVTDFGLVRVVSADAADMRLTVSDTPLGTPAYMAPEQLRDASTADQRSDVFSLGALLYELVTGRRAFAGHDWLEISDRIRAGRYEPPDRVVPGLPERMVRTIERCLRVDPDERFPDVASVLQAWVSPQPGTVTPRAPGRLRWPIRASFGAAVALALALGGSAAFLAVVSPQDTSDGTEAIPTVSDDPAVQRRFELGWAAFLVGDFRTALDHLERMPPDELLPRLVYAAALDFQGYTGRAWAALDDAARHAEGRRGRAATLTRLYQESIYPQARVDGWDAYLRDHPADFLAHLLAARVTSDDEDLQKQAYERAGAIAPPGSIVAEKMPLLLTMRRARRATSPDEVPRSGSFYDGYVGVGRGSPLWDADPASRWDLAVMMHRELVEAIPEEPEGRYQLAVFLGLASNETARQEQLSVLFSPATARLDRLRYATPDAWFEFGRGRWEAARSRLLQCESDAATGNPGRPATWSGPLFPEAILCADTRAEMALLLADPVEARDARDALADYVAQPEIPEELDRRIGAGLVYLDARIALLEGDDDAADEMRQRLVEGKYDFVRWESAEDVAYELTWRTHPADPVGASLYNQPRQGQGCQWGLGLARAERAAGEVDQAERTLRGLVSKQTCPEGPFINRFFRAEARVLLAETLAAQGGSDAAREQLDAFTAAWPRADPDHPLVARATALRKRLAD